MYIYNNRSEGLTRTFHRTFCVLSISTVLFSLPGCSRLGAYTDGSSASAVKYNIKNDSEYILESSAGEATEDSTKLPSDTLAAPENTSTPDSAELNSATLRRINSTYGVNIRYGSDVTWSYGTSGRGITDNELIASRLALLEECLGRYPLCLFKDLKEYSPITINLIDNLGGADGYTDASDGSEIQIALSCSNSDLYFKLAFHHELFHFIEYCIMYNFDNADELINTDEFTDTTLYGTDGYSGTIYDSAADIYSQYFISVYAKTNRLEDRAELFSYYMGNTVKKCMKYPDTPITLKMKKIADAVRICCPSLAEYEYGSLPWEEKLTYGQSETAQ